MAIRPSYVMQFSHPSRHSWSERYWARSNLSYEAFSPIALAFGQKRVKLLANKIELLNHYITMADEFRDAYPVADIEQPLPGKWNPDFGNQGEPDISPATILLRCYSGARGTKMIYLGGAPDADITSPDRPQTRLSVAWNAAFDDYKAALINDFAWLGVSTDPAVSPVRTINSLAPDLANSKLTVGVADTTGFEPGKKVRITGARYVGGPNPNRVWTITHTVTATAFPIANFESDDFQYLGGGQAQLQNLALFPITAVKITGATSRKRGATYGVRRGRVKTRK